jgi:hypothetical protein
MTGIFYIFMRFYAAGAAQKHTQLANLSTSARNFILDIEDKKSTPFLGVLCLGNALLSGLCNVLSNSIITDWAAFYPRLEQRLYFVSIATA